jgi:hypothetical protein
LKEQADMTLRSASALRLAQFISARQPMQSVRQYSFDSTASPFLILQFENHNLFFPYAGIDHTSVIYITQVSPPQ